MNMNNLKDALDKALEHTEATLLIAVQFEDGIVAIYPYWDFDGDLDETIILTAALAVDKYGHGAAMVAHAMKH